VIAGLERVQQVRRLSHRLNHNADCPARRVRAFDGNRNALAFLVNPQNHELARFLFTGDAGSFNDEPFDGGGEELGVDDLEYEASAIENYNLIVGEGS